MKKWSNLAALSAVLGFFSLFNDVAAAPKPASNCTKAVAGVQDGPVGCTGSVQKIHQSATKKVSSCCDGGACCVAGAPCCN